MDNNNQHEWGKEPEQSGEWKEEPNYGQGWKNTEQKSNGFGIASLVLGIISIVGLCMCLGPLTGVLAVIFGIIQIKNTPENKSASIAGIITGAIGILLSLIIMIILIFGLTLTESDLNQFNLQDIYEQIETNDV